MPEDGIIKQRQSGIALLQQGLEGLLIICALYLSAHFFHTGYPRLYDVPAFATALLYLFLANHNGLYGSWRGIRFFEEIVAVSKVWLVVVLVLLLTAYALKISSNYSRATVLSWMTITPVALVTLRVVVRGMLHRLRAQGHNIRRVVIAGTSPTALLLARNIKANPWMGIKLQGFYDDDTPPGKRPAEDLEFEVLGTLDKLKFDARTGNYDGIYLALPNREEDKLKDLVGALANTSTPVNYVPDLYTFNLVNSRVYDLAGIPTISVYDSPLDGVGRLVKRAEDIVLSSLVLAIIAIPLLVIAIAIKLTSPGPALFRQQRYGLGSTPFNVWKFRTMTVTEEGSEARQATAGDARITPLGNILRKTSLDELPQFFNVLQGSMSIVGPRPHPISLNEEYREQIDGYMLRHIIKPGITGWAQVNGWRGETDTHEKMAKRIEFDLHYIRNWSVLFDLRIISLTLFKGFLNSQA